MGLLYGKSGEPVLIGPLIGRPGSGDIAKSLVETLEIDFLPAAAHEESVSDPGEATAMEEGLVPPIPALEEVNVVTIPFDPDRV